MVQIKKEIIRLLKICYPTLILLFILFEIMIIGSNRFTSIIWQSIIILILIGFLFFIKYVVVPDIKKTMKNK